MAAPRGLHFPPGAARGASGVTQTCCPRPGAPVTVTALSWLVLLPVRAPGLQSSPRAVPELGALPKPLPAVAQHRGASARPLPPGFRNPTHAEGGKTPLGPRRAGAGSVTQCTAGELGHRGGGGSDSVLPVPSRHRRVLGARSLPAGAGAGRDAPRMQTSTRKFYGIFCELGSEFQHDDRRNEFLCALSRLQLSADKDLSVTTPTEGFCKPVKGFGSWQEKAEGFWIKPILIKGQTRMGRRRGTGCPEPLRSHPTLGVSRQQQGKRPSACVAAGLGRK